jgi:hypothetical protein
MDFSDDGWPVGARQIEENRNYKIILDSICLAPIYPKQKGRFIIKPAYKGVKYPSSGADLTPGPFPKREGESPSPLRGGDRGRGSPPNPDIPPKTWALIVS